MIRAILIIKGCVQKVGYRTLINSLAVSHNLTGIAENLADGSVKVVCEGTKVQVEKFIETLKVQKPSYAQIDEIKVDYEEYKGEFTSFERIGADVPKKGATLDDVLEVMKNFDSKAEQVVVILSKMNETLKSVKEDTSQIRKDTSILPSIKEDTSQIRKDTSILPSIKQDTSQIRKDTSILPSIKEDTSQIKENTEVIREKLTSLEEIQRYSFIDLRDKYDQLSAPDAPFSRLQK